MSWTHLAYIESDSEPGKRHEIKRAETGKLGCSCMKYRFMRGAVKTCHHIAAYEFDGTMPVVASFTTPVGSSTKSKVTHGGETFLIHRRAISFGALKP